MESQVKSISKAFATASSKAVSSSNLRRLQIAEGNVQAAVGQIELEETVQRREVARSLALFQGEQAAARAHRGGGFLGTGSAVSDAATAQAADVAAIIEANAANKEIAAVAANQVILDDPVLAAIQGAVEGMSIGTQIASALIEEAEVKTRQSSLMIDRGGASNIPTYENIITSYLEIPKFDLGEIIGD